jgi:hypothetical protein
MKEFYVDIENENFKSRKVVLGNLRGVANGRYKVILEEASKRTNQQNAYYWAVIVPIVFQFLREAGYNEILSHADAHEVLKFKFLRKTIVSEHGEYVEIIKSTAKLSKKDFIEYIEAIIQWVAETWGMVIPPPGTQTQMDI